MKICYLGSQSNIHTQRWVSFFAKLGHDVSLISNTDADKLEHVRCFKLDTFRTGLYVLDLVLGALSFPLKLLALKKLLHTIKPDVIHVHYINELALLAVLAGDAPVIVTAWGSDVLISPQKSWIRRLVLSYILKKSTLITCDADHMKEALVKLGALPEKIEIIFFGTDVQRFNPSKNDVQFKTSLGYSPEQKIVISTRNHEDVYRIEDLIQAIPLILKQFPDVMFHIGGSGSLTSQYRTMIQKLGIEPSVKFLGRLSQDDLPKHLAISAVYISTAYSDAGLASSTSEAMASGVPVVITDVVDNGKWIKDSDNGFLYKPSDVKMLSEKIIRLLDSEALREEFGKKGMALTVEKSNLYTEMDKMEKLCIRLSS
jgi:glycosyltransferase involved in cell wall biosynthesis